MSETGIFGYICGLFIAFGFGCFMTMAHESDQQREKDYTITIENKSVTNKFEFHYLKCREVKNNG